MCVRTRVRVSIKALHILQDTCRLMEISFHSRRLFVTLHIHYGRAAQKRDNMRISTHCFIARALFQTSTESL